MLLRLDHLVIAVPDPDAAATELEAAIGLVCTSGGRHLTWGTHNRIAWLGDTYVELIGLFDRSLAPAGAVSRAVLAAADADQWGLVSFAIATDDVDGDQARLAAAGSPLGEPQTRSRTRPDGELVTWRAAYADLGPTEPPFIVEHEPVGAEWGEAARAERGAFRHPLGGPARVRGLELPVPDVAEVATAYTHALGLEFDPQTAIAQVGDQWIRLLPGQPFADPAVVVIGLLEGEPAVLGDVDAVGVRWRVTRRR
jgi:hypothetical protein